jgi:hypothetical protein
MKNFKKLCVVMSLLVSLTIASSPQVQAVTSVWIGEFQNCQTIPVCANIEPPTELNIDQYDGRLGGLTPQQRCYNSGGIPHWHTTWKFTCLNVDY